jgi:hypothetical protein
MHVIETEHRHRWGVAVALAVVLIALHVMPADIFGFPIDSELFNLAHPIVFALVAFGVARYLTRHAVEVRGMRLRPYVTSICGIGAFALLAETSQIFSSRNASFGDLIRDAHGILSGVAFAYGMQRHRWQRALLWTLGVAVLGAASWGPGRVMAAHAAAAMRFPVFATFESNLEQALVRRIRARVSIVDAPAGWPGGGHVCRVEPLAWANFSGVAIAGIPRDIRGYEALTLTIATADASTGTVLVRVDTSGRAWRNQDAQVRYDVSGTPTTIRIPMADIAAGVPDFMDEARHIIGVVVFADPVTKAPLLLDDIRLE